MILPGLLLRPHVGDKMAPLAGQSLAANSGSNTT